MPFCKVNNANIYYEDIGTGIPIIMIHGYSPVQRLMSGCMEPIFKDKDWKVFSYTTVKNIPSQKVAEKIEMQEYKICEKNAEKQIAQVAFNTLIQ